MTAMYTIRRGGAYDRFIMMVEAFLEKKCEVHCLSLTPIRIEHPYYHNHVICFPIKKKDGLIAQLTVLSIFPLWAAWLGWSIKTDLVIAFGFLYAFVLGFSKCLLRRPMATLIRGSSIFGFKMQRLSEPFLCLNRIIENIGLRFSDRIITNNMASREEILKRRKEMDVQVLYNNILPISIHETEDISQTRNKYGIPTNAKVLVTAGVLSRGKNVELLVKCLPGIGGKNIYVMIAGDGSTQADLYYRRSLHELAKELRVDERVVFTGWLNKEELWKVYLASDIFVLPSLSEGMPNVMLEALGSGLPCIGSNIAGVKDILQHEDLMFDPQDEMALVNKIQKLFSDRQFFDKAKRLCQGRMAVFVFDWKEKAFETITHPRQSKIL